MDEQMISKAVEEVLRRMNSERKIPAHQCRCKKHKMTLALAKSLIQKVEQAWVAGGDCGLGSCWKNHCGSLHGWCIYCKL